MYPSWSRTLTTNTSTRSLIPSSKDKGKHQKALDIGVGDNQAILSTNLKKNEKFENKRN
jgi:hypothetical protein